MVRKEKQEAHQLVGPGKTPHHDSFKSHLSMNNFKQQTSRLFVEKIITKDHLNFEKYADTCNFQVKRRSVSLIPSKLWAQNAPNPTRWLEYCSRKQRTDYEPSENVIIWATRFGLVWANITGIKRRNFPAIATCKTEHFAYRSDLRNCESLILTKCCNCSSAINANFIWWNTEKKYTTAWWPAQW